MSQFTLALNTSTIRPATLMDKIRIAGETGYEAIELWNDDLTAYEEENGSLTDVKRALDDYGLPVTTVIALHDWLDTTGTEHQEALEEAKRRMAQAAAVGSTYSVASPPRGVADLKLGGQNYRELLELGREFGVKPAMEFLGFVGPHQSGQARVGSHGGCQPPRQHHRARSVPHLPWRRSKPMTCAESPLTRLGCSISTMHPPRRPRAEQTDADRVYPGDGILDSKRE